jgi:hypothetical protein
MAQGGGSSPAGQEATSGSSQPGKGRPIKGFFDSTTKAATTIAALITAAAAIVTGLVALSHFMFSGHSPALTDGVIKPGYYVDGGPSYPHWFILVNAGRGDAISGTIAFQYQDASTGMAHTFSGHVQSGLVTLNISHYGLKTGTFGFDSRREVLILDGCFNYLKWVTTRPQCTFTHAADLNGDQHVPKIGPG